MRRKDREITDENKIAEILSNCHCCRIGFCDKGEVYIVPLNFGYTKEEGSYTFYFHGAKEGRKVDLIKENPCVGFELDTNYLLYGGPEACEYTARFQSIIGKGVVTEICEKSEKVKAMNYIMLHNTKKEKWDYPDKMLDSTFTFQMKVESFSCKEHL